MNAKLICIMAATTLTGCAQFGAGVATVSGAYDESLQAAELWLCRGASVGAVVRAYGRDDATWDAWRSLCGLRGMTVERPVPPPAQ